MSKPLLTARGTNGQIELYEDRVRIRRKGFSGWMFQVFEGFKGDKDIFLSSLTGVQLKTASISFTGYIRFLFPGTVEPRRGKWVASHDENAVEFLGWNSKECEAIRDMIYEFQSPHPKQQPQPQPQPQTVPVVRPAVPAHSYVISCPHCASRVSVLRIYAGQLHNCPHCNGSFNPALAYFPVAEYPSVSYESQDSANPLDFLSSISEPTSQIYSPVKRVKPVRPSAENLIIEFIGKHPIWMIFGGLMLRDCA